jgi:putative RNA 2'-phosphotransferase
VTGRDRLIRISKLLSLMLRHEPQRFGLLLDPEGYASVEDVLGAVRTRIADATEADLTAIVSTLETNKQRFTIIDGEIRANYGHSLAERITHERAVPPPLLWHGTTLHAMDRIRETGLLPMKRQYVHLTTDTQLAARIGARHGVAHILTIDAAQAHHDGVVFYRANPFFWLADTIPARYCQELVRPTPS